MKNRITIVIITVCVLCLFNTQRGYSQLKGDRLLGGTGLEAATQAPAGTVTLLVPLYFYNTTSLKDADGNKTNTSPNLKAFITGVGLSFVSGLKIFNANYGATVLVPFAQNRIEGNSLNSASPFAFSDIYVQPVQLGWHTKTADFSFNYGLYIPTGKYAIGASDNSGLGMLVNEFSAGTTLKFDQKGTITFASLLSYELHSDKKGTDIKTGDILSVEGGLGKAFYMFNGTKIPSAIIKAGIVYYMQFKMTDDQIPVQSIIISPGRDRTYGLGLEGSVLVVKPRLLLGLRWTDDFGGVNRFQGNTFFVTLAHILSTGHRSGE